MKVCSLAAACIAVTFSIGAVAEHADAAIVFTFHMTVSNAGAGYQVGDAASYTFTLQPLVAPGSQSTFAGKTTTRWNSGQVWSTVSGTGVSGAWEVPSLPNDGLEMRSDSNLYMWIYDRADAVLNSGTGSYLEVDATFGVAGNQLSWDSSVLDANAYFSGRVGTYQASAGAVAYAYTSSDNAVFTVNSLEISNIPAPGAVALIGLAGLTARRRRG